MFTKQFEPASILFGGKKYDYERAHPLLRKVVASLHPLTP